MTMTFAGSTFTLAFARQAVIGLRQTVRHLVRRREISNLHALDDRMLADIGLHRSDVESALQTPITEDPSLVLADLAGHPRAPQVVVDTRGLARLRRDDAPLSQPTTGKAPFAA